MVDSVTRGWPIVLLRRALVLALIAAGLGLFEAHTANAQLGFSVPSQSYYSAFTPFLDGDHREALNLFQNEARGGIKAGTNRWIDSICSFTMVGECYYQMGQHQAALVQYTSALQLYYAFNDWMVRVQFQPGIRPSNPGEFKPLPWGRSSRAFVLGHYPETVPIIQGQFTNAQTLVAQGGGVVSAPIGYSIGVQEIVRCTALAMRRRRELMGPACAQDQLTNDLITALGRRPGPANHWSECWIDFQLGIAYSCGGKNDQAKATLERSVLAAGQFDHPLTGMAFLELGRLALLASDYSAAANYFAEASYSAALYKDPVVVEEAFRFGQLTHLMSNQPGVFAPLAAATLWSKANSLRQLNVWTQILAAENYCVIGQPQTASTLLASAASSIGRRTMGVGKVGARLNFITALALYQQSNVTAGDQKLAVALAFQKNGSLRLFHIALADTLYSGGTVTPRVAMDLYNETLRDPTPMDWAADPLEALSLMVVPHHLAYEHWFEVAVDRKDHERLLEISDLARRHRFLSTLEFGGRVHNLRWLLEGPEDILDQAGRLERQDLLARYTDYDKLHQEAQRLHTELKHLPLVPDDPTATRTQSDKLARLAEVSQSQELLLRQMAVRREPCSLVFPPVRSTKDIRAALPPGHALLSFFSTPRQAYALLLTHDKYGYWKIPHDESLLKPVMKLLQSLGSVDPNRQLTLKEIEAGGWKEQGKQILDSLTKDSRADLKSFTQLIIVPDGALWYLPFEALPIADGDEQVPLVSKIPIRYAPLVSLGIADPRPRRAGGNTAVVLGKLILGGDASQADAAFDEIGKALPGVVALRSRLAHDAAEFATLFDGLIVLNEVPTSDEDPYDWSPLPQDQNATGTIANWFALPWGGPDFIIMPSYHTAAERAMKKQVSEPGREVFLSVCGLMANGARTILVSRWRTGGQSSVDLVREFVQELPHASAAEAWQRSIAIVSENPLNPAAEPRLRLTASEEPPKADHPFFWSGYMLVDTGTLPQEVVDGEQKDVEPDAAPKKPDSPLAARLLNPAGNGPDTPAVPAAPLTGLGGAGAMGNKPGGLNGAARPATSNPLFDNAAQANQPASGPTATPTDNAPAQKPTKQPTKKGSNRKTRPPKNSQPNDFPDGGVIPTNPWADETIPADEKPAAKRVRGKPAAAKSSSSKSGPSKAARGKTSDPPASDPPAANDPSASDPPPANP